MSEQPLDIQSDQDIEELREFLRAEAEDRGFSGYEATRLVTAASEISRNLLQYAGGGVVTINPESGQTADPGAMLVLFEDDGPGIEDVDRAMEDGYSGENSSGLGVGLPGAERLADEFEIQSDRTEGTTVRVVVEPSS